MTLIVTAVRKYAVGIDLGGTFIKGGIADDLGNIIAYDKVETEAKKGDKAVAKNISDLCLKLIAKANMSVSDMRGAGMGVPGMIDSKNGEVVYANNLGWSHFKISEHVEKQSGLKVAISNDANVAALGEAMFGEGKGCRNTVMLTLGTGVGGGLVLDGKLYEASTALAGAEVEIIYDPLNTEEIEVRYQGITPIKAKRVRIGSFADKKPPVPVAMTDQIPETSRLLDALEKRYKEDHKLFADAISFAGYGKEGSGNV